MDGSRLRSRSRARLVVRESVGVFETWKDWFPPLLGIIVGIVGFVVRRIERKWDCMSKELKKLRKDVVNIRVAMGGEQRGGEDRRRAALEFYGGAERRFTGERRSR